MGVNRSGYEVSVSGTDGPVHQAEDDIRLADRNAVQMTPELSRCVLLKLSDRLILDIHLQIHIGIERDLIPIMVNKSDVHVSCFCADIDLKLTCPRSGVAVVRRIIAPLSQI